MKINIIFKDSNGSKIKKLGSFWCENKDFYIEINTNQPEKEKLITFIEEMLHLIFFVIFKVTKKEMSLRKEHQIINQIMAFFRVYKII